MKPGSERCTEYGSTPEINQWNPKGTPVFFAFRNQRFLESKGDACLLKGHVRQNMTYAYHCIPMLWQHTESSPMSPPRVAISGKITLSISFENFNFLLLNAFVQKQTMTTPFSPPPAVLLAPGVYFRQQNSDDSKSLIDSFFCSVDHALNLPLGFCWCHGVIGVTIGFLSEKKTKDLGLGFCSFPEIGVLSLIFLWPGK